MSNLKWLNEAELQQARLECEKYIDTLSSRISGQREHPSALRNFATHRTPSWRDKGHEIRRLTLEVVNNELIPEPKRR